MDVDVRARVQTYDRDQNETVAFLTTIGVWGRPLILAAALRSLDTDPRARDLPRIAGKAVTALRLELVSRFSGFMVILICILLTVGSMRCD